MAARGVRTRRDDRARVSQEAAPFLSRHVDDHTERAVREAAFGRRERALPFMKEAHSCGEPVSTS